MLHFKYKDKSLTVLRNQLSLVVEACSQRDRLHFLSMLPWKDKQNNMFLQLCQNNEKTNKKINFSVVRFINAYFKFPHDESYVNRQAIGGRS